MDGNANAQPADFATSAEHEGVRVLNDYSKLLGLTPSPGEVPAWVSALLNQTLSQEDSSLSWWDRKNISSRTSRRSWTGSRVVIRAYWIGRLMLPA